MVFCGNVDVDIDYSYWAGMKAANSLKSYIKNKGWNKIARTTSDGYKYNDWFYVNDDGLVAIGWKKINSKWYYFSTSDGLMQGGGSRNIFGDIYVFDNSGAKITSSGWVSVKDLHYGNTDWYYLDSKGLALVGLQDIGNKKYFFNEKDGKMFYSVISKIDGHIFYFEASGALYDKNGWIKLNNSWYYFASNGYGQRGWKFINNKWYYFNDNGVMQEGWQKINNKWYYFRWGEGDMYSSRNL